MRNLRIKFYSDRHLVTSDYSKILPSSNVRFSAFCYRISFQAFKASSVSTSVASEFRPLAFR